MGDFPCEFCGKWCASEHGLKVHIAIKHNQEKAAKMAANERLDKLLAHNVELTTAVTKASVTAYKEQIQASLSSAFGSVERYATQVCTCV